MALSWIWVEYMKKIALLMIICVCSTNLPAQELPFIPQRVLLELNSTIESSLVENIPNLLFANISNYTPIVRVYEDEEWDSKIVTEVRNLDNQQVEIVATLFQSDSTFQTESFLSNREISDWDGLLEFINRTARSFSEYLGLVEPIVIETEFAAQQREFLEDVSFADSLATPVALHLIISTLRIGMNTPALDIQNGFLLPIRFDAAFYQNRSDGFLVSLLVNYNEGLNGVGYNIAEDIIPTRFFYLMAGIGFTTRTLGTISAEFSAVQYFGYLNIENLTGSDLYKGTDSSLPVYIPANGTAEEFYLLTQLKLNINFNIDRYFSIGLQSGFEIHPFLLVGLNREISYSENLLFRLTFLNLVLSIRP
jgi:hypothetical protein